MQTTPDEIRTRFDRHVERFSNLETGQTATMDGVLCMELVAQAAARTVLQATHMLDIGCGAAGLLFL